MTKQEFIKLILSSPSKCRASFIEKNYFDIFQQLSDYSIKNNLSNIPFKEQIYCWVYEYNPYCSLGKKRSFISLVKGYYTGCGKINVCLCAKELYQKSMIEKHGVINPWKNKSIHNKMKQTMIKKYGFVSPIQIESFKKQIKQTNLERYGVDNSAKNEEIKLKTKQTNIKKYGTISKNSIKIPKIIQEIIHDENKFSDFINGKSPQKALNEIKKIYNLNESHFYNLISKYNCSNIVDWTIKSHKEFEINDWLNHLGINTIQNSRKLIPPMEIDIFLPDYNIGIEYCGIYWHSTKFKEEDYHYKKFIQATSNNIKLIQIFENEYLENPKIVKNVILKIINNSFKLSIMDNRYCFDLDFVLLNKPIKHKIYNFEIFDAGKSVIN